MKIKEANLIDGLSRRWFSNDKKYVRFDLSARKESLEDTRAGSERSPNKSQRRSGADLTQDAISGESSRKAYMALLLKQILDQIRKNCSLFHQKKISYM